MIARHQKMLNFCASNADGWFPSAPLASILLNRQKIDCQIGSKKPCRQEQKQLVMLRGKGF